jgi:superfamily II DNA helicase RecQ
MSLASNSQWGQTILLLSWQQSPEPVYTLPPATNENRMIEMFHSGTGEITKDRVQKDMKNTNSTIRIVVCSIAFVMGIDIPNIRNVVTWWGMPESILNLWQEIGRGGQDGQVSAALCLFFHKVKCVKNAKTKNMS